MHGDFAEPSVRQNQLLTMVSRITHTNVHETRTDKSRCELRETVFGKVPLAYTPSRSLKISLAVDPVLKYLTCTT